MPFAESTRPSMSGELYVGIQIRLLKVESQLLFFYLFRFPGLRYRAYSPLPRQEWLNFESSYQPTKIPFLELTFFPNSKWKKDRTFQILREPGLVLPWPGWTKTNGTDKPWNIKFQKALFISLHVFLFSSVESMKWGTNGIYDFEDAPVTASISSRFTGKNRTFLIQTIMNRPIHFRKQCLLWLFLFLQISGQGIAGLLFTSGSIQFKQSINWIFSLFLEPIITDRGIYQFRN